MLWARLTFGRRSFHLGANPTPGELVTSGPYRLWRHPIYAAIIYFVWAGIAGHLSPLSVLVGTAVTAALFTRMFVEEGFLRAQYPGYADHAARTCRLIPWLL
jgi:protein-S-isoprenylcysteine O-methyltransferase Ste14